MTTHSQQPLFSIATPCFNSAKTIERTFMSILAQEFKDYEYIVVDGGSTDGTIDIIKQYEPLFEGRMRWMSESDKGIYDAINKGIERSTGIYCWNINSDDYMESNALNIFADAIHVQDCPPSIVSGAVRFIKTDGTTAGVSHGSIIGYKKALKRHWMGIPHPGAIVSRKVYEQYGMYDDRFYIAGDKDWFLRIAKAGVPVLFLDTIVTNMVQGGISTTPQKDKIKHDESLILKKHSDNIFQYIFFKSLSYYYSLKKSFGIKSTVFEK